MVDCAASSVGPRVVSTKIASSARVRILDLRLGLKRQGTQMAPR